MSNQNNKQLNKRQQVKQALNIVVIVAVAVSVLATISQWLLTYSSQTDSALGLGYSFFFYQPVMLPAPFIALAGGISAFVIAGLSLDRPVMQPRYLLVGIMLLTVGVWLYIAAYGGQ